MGLPWRLVSRCKCGGRGLGMPSITERSPPIDQGGEPLITVPAVVAYFAHPARDVARALVARMAPLELLERGFGDLPRPCRASHDIGPPTAARARRVL